MKNIFKALADFQQEVPILFRDSDGYGYKFTDLPEISRVITPYMKKHNLGYTQLIQGKNLETHIFHTISGESIVSSAEIVDETLKGMNKFQSFGSGLTYMRRYALSAALGLITDGDIDAGTMEDKLSRIETVSDLNALYKNLDDKAKKKFVKLFEKRKNEIIFSEGERSGEADDQPESKD